MVVLAQFLKKQTDTRVDLRQKWAGNRQTLALRELE